MKMKNIILLLLIVLLASCGSEKTAGISSDSTKEISAPAATPVQSAPGSFGIGKGRYRDGELLVKFRSGVKAASSLRTHQTIGAASLKKFSLIPNLEHVKLPEGLSVEDAIAQYMRDPNVEYAEPNYLKRIFRTPNDSLFGQQWGLQNTGQNIGGTIGTAGADIKATAAWDVTTGSQDIVIAVIDTGIDFTHTDLAHNIWSNVNETCSDGIDHDGNGFPNDCKGWDFTTCANFNENTGACIASKSPDNNPADDNGHGTHVSGIIGAEGNNNTGIAGVVWSIRIMPLKFLNFQGGGSIADELDALGYAVMMKNRGINIKVINASFAGSDFSQFEYTGISQANAAGIVLTAAAGNENVDNDIEPSYPASFGNPNDAGLVKAGLPALTNIISVAASDLNDNRASFGGGFASNYGINSVHVAAPGLHILSTSLSSQFCEGSQYAGYAFCSGTSMATPHVSGLTGLLYSVYPGFTYSQIRGMIIKYVDVLPSFQDKIFSSGRINAFKSVSSLLAPSGLNAASSSPTQAGLIWTDNATGEDGYKIERKAGEGSFGQIAAPGVNATSFSDSGLTDGTNYVYRVRAFTSSLPNPGGSPLGEANSSYSNESSATTPLNPPSGLSATNVTTNSLTLSWSDNSQSEGSYKIERKSPGGDFVQIATVGANVATFSDSGLSPDTTYSYRVRASNAAAGNSQYSNEISAKTSSTSPGPQPSSGGGGGCSIGARQNAPTAAADCALLLIPVAVIALFRRRRH